MKAIILAAGLGTNLHPLTETRPKPMISICGKPVLEYIVEGLVESGNTDIIMIIGPHAQAITEYFGRGEQFQARITYIKQEEPWGIGKAMLLAESSIPKGEQFFVVYSDILFEKNIFTHILSLATTLRPTGVAALTLTRRVHPQCDTVTIDGDSHITHITAQGLGDDVSGFVLAGVYLFETGFFHILREAGGDMRAALDRLIKRHALLGSIFEYDWIDLGYPWNILEANHFLMRSFQYARIARTATLEGNVTISGPVRIEKDVVIGSGSKINGPCYIGPGTYIGNNVLIRKHTSIGANSVVGFGVELKDCVIFDEVKVGRLSFIGESVVGEQVEIGSGVMTVNNLMTGETVVVDINGDQVNSQSFKLGAFIGDQAKIGSGNTLRPGTIIPAQDVVPINVSL